MDLRKMLANAAASPPSPPATPSDGYPSNGNPGTGTPPGQPGAYWFHQIAEELRAIIVAAGLTPDHEDLDQLLTAVRMLGGFRYSGLVLFDTVGADTYTPSSNDVVLIDPWVIAGGASGGGAQSTSSTNCSHAPGGSAGGMRRALIPIADADSYSASLVIGAGGNSANGNTAGNAGGASSFDDGVNVITATGGAGGTAGAATDNFSVRRGSAGGGGSGGDARSVRGAPGGNSFSLSMTGNPRCAQGGNGGNSPLGGGGGRGASQTSDGQSNGEDGQNYGAGGGGAASRGGTAAASGAGFKGAILVFEYTRGTV